MRRALAPLLLLFAAAPVGAQGASGIVLGGPSAPAEVVAWRARAVPEAGRAGTYRIELTGEIVDGWRVYGMRSEVGRPLRVTMSGLPAGFRLVGMPAEHGSTHVGYDEAFARDYPYFAGRAGVVTRVAAGRDVRPGRHVVRGTVRYAACDDRVCLPPREAPFEAVVTVPAER